MKFDALGLPRDTLFSEIATLRRFVCEECGRRAMKVEVDWEAKESGRHGTWGVKPPG